MNFQDTKRPCHFQLLIGHSKTHLKCHCNVCCTVVLLYYTVIWLRCIVAHTMIEFGVLTHIYAHNRCKVFILYIDRWIEYRVHWRKSECVSNASVKLVTFDIWQGESNKNRKNRAKKIRTNCSTWQHCSKKKEIIQISGWLMNEKKIQLRVSRFSLCVFRCLFSIVVILDGEGENQGKPKRQ